MAATGTPTTNLGLRIMNGTDPVDVADINANSQTLDDKIGAVGSTSLQAQITSANEAIGNLANLTTTEKGSLVGATNELNSKIVNNNISSATSIASLVSGIANDESRDYFASSSNLLTDFPAVMTSAGATSYVQIHITRRTGTLTEIFLSAVTNQNSPRFCVGKLYGSTIYWEQLALDSRLPNVPQVGKLLRSETINSSETSSISIPDLSKYNVFAAMVSSSYSNGPAFGIRSSSGVIRFMGTSQTGTGWVNTYAIMNVSGDSFSSWNAASAWGTQATGIGNIIGIC